MTWRSWTITASFGDRYKVQPVSWGSTVFNDPGTHVDDRRGFVEAAYARETSLGALRWRVYYDDYHELARFDYPLGPGVDQNNEVVDGKWIGTQLTDRFDLPRVGTLTVGTEAKLDLRAFQGDQDVSPSPFTYLSANNPDRSIALFAQEEKKLSARWTIDAGLRYDYSYVRHSFVSPRVAAIYRPSSWTYKFLYGRSFRNPSTFELFYNDDGLSGLSNPSLRPEKADTFEVNAERAFGARWSLLTAAYGYVLRDFIVATRGAGGLIQYQNVGQIHAYGLETELTGRLLPWLEATASYSIQVTRDLSENSTFENSPDHLVKLRLAAPLGRKFEASSSLQYMSSRQTLAQSWVSPALLSDFTVTSRRLWPNFDFQLGLRNTFNQSYADPIALNPLVDTMPQPGRTWFVRLIAHAAR